MSRSTTRQRLGLIAGSVELCSLAIASYIPSRVLRIVVLRCWGARVSLRSALHHGLQVRAARRLEVGPDTFIAEGVVLDARGGLRIGPHTSINTGVQIWTAQHDWRAADFAYVSAPVRIGHHCWVSARAVVLPGVTIGDGAVVAAGAVVTKDVAPWTLVGGNPARLLRERPRDLDYELDAVKNKPWWW